MANTLTTTFQASFVKFYDEVAKAQASLRAFGDTTADAGKRVSGLADTFSGRKIIEQAVATAKAIEDIGGAAVLTDAEAKRVNRTMAEALAKVAALGPEASRAIGGDAVKALQTMAQQTERASASTGLLQRGVSWATVAVGNFAANLATQAVQALQAFARAAFEGAGHVLDLSDQTGLSVTSIQQMQYAAALTGTEVEKFTTAAYTLGITLAGGGGSVENALNKIQLSAAQVDLMSVDQQFMAITDGLHGLTDAGERNRVGAELFGAKVWKEIAPAVVQGYRQMVDGLNTATQEQLAAIDRLSDRWDGFKVTLGVVTEQIIAGTISAFDQMSTAMGKAALAEAGQFELLAQVEASERQAAAAAREHGEAAQAQAERSTDYVAALKAVQAAADGLAPSVVAQILASRELGASTKDVARELHLSEDVVAAVQKAHTDAAKATDAHAEAIRSLRDTISGAGAVRSVKDLEAAFVGLTPAQQQNAQTIATVLDKYDDLRLTVGGAVAPTLEALYQQHGTLTARTVDLRVAVDMLPPTFERMSAAAERSMNVARGLTEDGLIPMLETVRQFPATMGPSVKSVEVLASPSLWSKIGDTAKSTVGGINDIFTAAFEGGGGVAGAIKSFATNAVSGMLSLIPGIGGFVSQFSGAIVAGVSRLFGGVSKEVQQARADIGQFEAKLGSTLTALQKAEAGGERWKETTIAVRDAYLAVGRTAAEAEAITRQLWNDSNPARVKAAIEEINGVLDEQKQHQQDLQAAIERYGFTFEELGPALQRQQLSEQVQQLIGDFTLLTSAGIDMDTVIARMGESINKFVQQAVASGTEVPSSMRPILEHMIEQGRLTDANGKKIADLKDSGITFGETLTQGFDRVVKKLDELIARLTGHYPEATDAATTATETFTGSVVDNMNTAAEAVSGVAEQINNVADAASKIGSIHFPTMPGATGGGGGGSESAGRPRVVVGGYTGGSAEAAINAVYQQALGRDATPAEMASDKANADRYGLDGSLLQDIADRATNTPGQGDRQSFASGTWSAGGWFRNFGAGTPVMLHGDEAVIRRDQAGAFAREAGAGSAEMLGELRSLRSDLAALPHHLARAVRDAVLVAG